MKNYLILQSPSSHPQSSTVAGTTLPLQLSSQSALMDRVKIKNMNYHSGRSRHHQVGCYLESDDHACNLEEIVDYFVSMGLVDLVLALGGIHQEHGSFRFKIIFMVILNVKYV